jgi:urease accessory protein
MGESFDAMATLLLSGPTSTPVVKRALELERKIAATLTRTRRDSSESDEEGTGDIDAGLVDLINSLGGQVLLSVTPVEHHDTATQQKQLHMVRIIAGSNEDIYRILHYCLKDCSVHFGGLEPYKERIHSSKTVRQKNIPLVMQQQQTERWRNKGKDLQSVVEKLGLIPAQDNNDAWFRLCTLSDSALPIGSFAHSQGIEAASQMQLFKRSSHSNNRAEPCSIDALSDFIYSISRSNARFSTPLIMAGYSLIQQSTTESSLPVEETLQLWSEIDNYTDTMLLTNRPGRRASIDQGLGLVRIASSFANDRNDKHDLNPDIATDLWTLISQSIDNNDERSMAKGHAAPIYGILSATLGITPLDCCRVFAFGATRDAVSAAVRLNLIGPMAGLTLLDKIGRKAVEDGLEEGLIGMLQSSRDLSPDEFSSQARIKYWLQSVHTCAPVLDASQPLADILSVRLFRT